MFFDTEISDLFKSKQKYEETNTLNFASANNNKMSSVDEKYWHFVVTNNFDDWYWLFFFPKILRLKPYK